MALPRLEKKIFSEFACKCSIGKAIHFTTHIHSSHWIAAFITTDLNAACSGFLFRLNTGAASRMGLSIDKVMFNIQPLWKYNRRYLHIFLAQQKQLFLGGPQTVIAINKNSFNARNIAYRS
jgi:hypothetical protein